VRRIASIVVLAAVVTTSLTGCGSKERSGEKEVNAAIAATRLEPLRFVYSVSAAKNAFQVQGLVEDDFRYKARLVRDSAPVVDEVVNDDAIAVRFAQPTSIGAFVDDTQRQSADLKTDLNGVNVIDVLRARRWVLDPVGAPLLTSSARSGREIDKDPIFDALGVLSYVEQAMQEADEVHRWDKDDLNPAYRASEDVFPQPSKDSGVKRYDLRRPPLPAIGGTGASAADSVPQAKHFRKMAIYVKDGRVIRVMERIEITGKAGDDFIGYLKRFGKQAGVSDAELKQGIADLKGMNDKQRSDALLQVVSIFLSTSGQAPIQPRIMSIDLRDIGDEGISATLPKDTIKGSLAILLNRGKKIEANNASGSPTAPSASASASARTATTTSTTSAP
jgi:hypothetical protein